MYWSNVSRKTQCKVFISYSRHDEEVVKPLARLLAGVTADPVFLDIDSIKPGDIWESEIETALRASAVFILCWCCQSEKSMGRTKEKVVVHIR